MRTVTLLIQADCSLCEQAKDVLVRVSADHPLHVEEISLDTEQGRRLALSGNVLFAPGILLDGKPFGYGRLSEKKLRRELAKAGQR